MHNIRVNIVRFCNCLRKHYVWGGDSMELRLVYEQLQGDYDDVIGRLLTEDRVKKYLFKFMDSPTMSLLLEALEKEDFEVAFRESHNLKGISANLGLSKLYTIFYKVNS